MARQEIRLAGNGGQGVILASVILADAAVIAGKNAAQSQSYGPEARGGVCKAECIISDDEIGYTKVEHPTFLMALTQRSLEHYTKDLPKECVILADASLTFPEYVKDYKTYSLPILSTAREKVGKAFTANIVALGAINKLLGLVSEEQLREAVTQYIPKGTEEINLKALDAGEALV